MKNLRPYLQYVIFCIAFILIVFFLLVKPWQSGDPILSSPPEISTGISAETTAPPVTDSPEVSTGTSTETTAPPVTEPCATVPPPIGVGLGSSSSVAPDHFSTAPSHLYPFVYSETNDLQNIELGPNDCVDGYLYVKNRNTGEILQILDEPILAITETKNALYCITEDSRIIKTDYTGETYELLYPASSNRLSCLDYYNGALYFMDGNCVQKIDLSTGESITLFQQEGMALVFPYADTKLLIYMQEGDPISYDPATGECKVLSGNRAVEQELAP